jgi:hypothetical protein
LVQRDFEGINPIIEALIGWVKVPTKYYRSESKKQNITNLASPQICRMETPSPLTVYFEAISVTLELWL